MTLSTFLTLLVVGIVLAIMPGPDSVLALRFGLGGKRAGYGSATGSALGMLIWATVAVTGLSALLEASDLAYSSLKVIGGAYLVYLGWRTISQARKAGKESALTAEAELLADLADPTSDVDPDGTPGRGGSRVDLDSADLDPSGLLDGGGHADRAAASAGDGGLKVATRPARTAQAAPSYGKGLAAGTLSALTNPKTCMFFVALFPQLTPAGANTFYVVGVFGGFLALINLTYLFILVTVTDAAASKLANPRVSRIIEGVSGVILAGLGLFVLVGGAPDLVTAALALA